MYNLVKLPEKYQFWDESFILDIVVIDKQHKRFYQLFEKLQELNKEGGEVVGIFKFIDELNEYTHYHFKTEEALMEKVNFPGIKDQIEQHAFFSKKVEEFRLAYTYKNVVLIDQMIGFMRKWFLMHISEEDRKYAGLVQEYMNNKKLKNK